MQISKCSMRIIKINQKVYISETNGLINLKFCIKIITFWYN